MILTCPACATRYQTDEAKFTPAGRPVRCAKCGHVWHQAGPEPQSGPVAAAPAPQPAPQAILGAVSAPPAPNPVADPERATRTRAYAHIPHAAPAKPRIALLPLLGVALGWIGLIVLVGLIGLSAVRYRQEITVIWPQSTGVYNSLGMKVNTHGIDFAHVNYHRESEDGQVVLAVTGQIVNGGTRELPVPQNVRVTLSDGANHEVYHWSFTPPAQTLKPGQAVAFLTRLSSPPATARHLEVRFASDSR